MHIFGIINERIDIKLYRTFRRQIYHFQPNLQSIVGVEGVIQNPLNGVQLKNKNSQNHLAAGESIILREFCL